MERRRHHRIPTKFELLYSSGRREGAGVLANISYSGARIEETQLQPPIGDQLRFYVFLQPVAPLELVGVVVRHTETGFAIEYDKVEDPEVRRLVDDAAAIVNG